MPAASADVRHLVAQLPHAGVHVASDGIAGLAMYGRLRPDLLLLDVVLCGIDVARLIATLRSNPNRCWSGLAVITALDEGQRRRYAYALHGLPVVNKSRLDQDFASTLAPSL